MNVPVRGSKFEIIYCKSDCTSPKCIVGVTLIYVIISYRVKIIGKNIS
jgi:hypothetical protein